MWHVIFLVLMITLQWSEVDSIAASVAPLNLAAGRPAYQSTTYTSHLGPQTAHYAVDGNLTTWGWACAVTVRQPGDWWLVDIGGPHRVGTIIITNRGDTECSCGHRLSDFYIRVGNSFDETTFDPTTFTECWYQADALADGETRNFTCNSIILGIYVAIHFPTTKTEHLQLCEVEVFSDLEKLTPNIAKNGVATQSTDHVHAFWGDACSAQYAIDGNFTTNLDTIGCCAHTHREYGAWWQVDLLRVYEIDKVSVTGRNVLASRLSDFYIGVSNNSDGNSAQQCAHELTPFLESESRLYTCPPGLVGRYVRIWNPPKPVYKSLSEHFHQNAPAPTGFNFLPCLSKCLLDETCTAVNLDGESCILLSPYEYSSNEGVEFYLIQNEQK